MYNILYNDIKKLKELNIKKNILLPNFYNLREAIKAYISSYILKIICI